MAGLQSVCGGHRYQALWKAPRAYSIQRFLYAAMVIGYKGLQTNKGKCYQQCKGDGADEPSASGDQPINGMI